MYHKTLKEVTFSDIIPGIEYYILNGIEQYFRDMKGTTLGSPDISQNLSRNDSIVPLLSVRTGKIGRLPKSGRKLADPWPNKGGTGVMVWACVRVVFDDPRPLQS